MNARTCYLHIGMHKTGSSSIQATLFAIGDCGSLVYADISGISNHSGALISIFAKGADRHHANVKRGLSGEQLEAQRLRFRAGLAAAIAAAPDKDLLISGEGISTLLEDELHILRQYLLESFAQIRVIGYVRSPKSYLESNFQQLVKGDSDRLSLDDLYLGYRDRFEKFDRVFGREQVLLRKFAPESFPDGCVVRDFCRLLDIDIEMCQIQRANEGISRAAVTLLYTYRKFGPGFGVGWGVIREYARLAETLATIKGPKLTFSPVFMADILRRNRDDIAWMEERIGVSLEEPLTSRPTDVTTEDDLLHNENATVAALAALLEPSRRPQPPYPQTPEAIAEMVHRLRLQLADERALQTHARQFLADLGCDELAERFSLSDQSLAALLRAMFRQIGRLLVAVEDGSLQVVGLGRFHVRPSTDAAVDGTSRSRRIVFVPSESRPTGATGTVAGGTTAPAASSRRGGMSCTEQRTPS